MLIIIVVVIIIVIIIIIIPKYINQAVLFISPIPRIYEIFQNQLKHLQGTKQIKINLCIHTVIDWLVVS